MFYCFVTKHAYDGQTDRLPDRQNYDVQDRASIAASHGRNRRLPDTFSVFHLLIGCFILILALFAN